MFGRRVSRLEARQEAGTNEGPRPVSRVPDESGPDGIVHDVLERVVEVLLILDDPGREALGEERAPASMARVVLPRVVALEPLDSARKVLRSALEDRVVVGSHQTAGVKAKAETDDRTAEEREEQQPVECVSEEPRLVHAVRGHVEIAVRQLGAKDSGHAPTLGARRPADRPPSYFLSSFDTTARGGPSVRHSPWPAGPRRYPARRSMRR